MIKKYCILFAGMVGSSKTPIAHFLSCNLGLPIFDNDAIRTEVVEDFMDFDVNDDQYLARRDKRMHELVMSGYSFISSSGIDRSWRTIKPVLVENDYEIFIISIDLSRTFIEKLYIAKGYADSLERIELLYQEHEEFLKYFTKDVSLQIRDEKFPDRLELSLKKVQNWISLSK